MDLRTLGRSGLAVSTYALGTMTFGNESSEEVSHAQLDRFVEQGGTSSTPPTCTRRGVVGGDHRAVAGGARPRCATGRARHQGPLRDGRRAATTSA